MFVFRVCVVLLAIAAAVPVRAQQTVDQASVAGRVSDPIDTAIAGARIDARHLDTNAVVTTVSDDRGRFRFAYLRPGPYEIIASSEGFETAIRHLTLTGGSAFELALQLSIPGLEDHVTVTGATPVIETARSQIAGTVPEAAIRTLPMNSRNFLEIGLLLPGVAATNIASTQLFPETSAVPGITLSVAGQRNLSNNFIVDGLAANDDAAGLSGMTFSVDAIEEFQVITSGGQAELGRALGGHVNIVTRSGTNVGHGGVYGYFRDDSMNGQNQLTGDTLPMRQWQYGASAGGPIARDRTFFFVNGEQRRLEQSGLVTIASADAAIINARLQALGYAGPPVAPGQYDSPLRTSNLLAKVDHQATERDRIGVRYVLYDASAEHARGAGGLTAPSASQHLDNLDQALSLHNTLTLGARTVLESRGQVVRSVLDAPPSDPFGPAVSIAGVSSFGTLSSSPAGRRNTLYQAVNNLSHLAGAHALRAGLDVAINDSLITFPRAARGSYAFASLDAFLAGTYRNAGFTQTFGDTEVAQSSTSIGMYLQDEWHASPALTVNLGLRYDLQTLETIDLDTNNVSPRVGFAWAPFADRRTVLRGNVGIFYDRVPLRALANALLSAGNTTDVSALRQITIALSPGQTAAPAFPALLDAPVPSITLPNLTTMDRQLQNASSRQASLEVERQLSATATVSATYQYVRGVDLLMSLNQNAPACAPAGNNNGCRPNPNYANNAQYSAAGSSSYHGLLVSLVGRPAEWGGYRVSYTLSKTMTDTGEFFFSSPIDPTDPSSDWGRSDNDQRHRIAAHAYAQTAAGLGTSVTMQAASAPPFNITSGLTTVQGTAGRPLVDRHPIARNSGEGSAFFTLNARVSQRVHAGAADVELSLEGFNLTNHRNVVARNGNFGTGAYPDNPAANFAQVTALGDPRSFQLGLRVRF